LENVVRRAHGFLLKETFQAQCMHLRSQNDSREMSYATAFFSATCKHLRRSVPNGGCNRRQADGKFFLWMR
jgi:hypothetical protein